MNTFKVQNFAESFKDKLDKFSQVTEEKFNNIKTAIQNKLNENDKPAEAQADRPDNSADLLQGWTLLGGDKNTRNKSIEFDDPNDLVADEQQAQQAQQGDGSADDVTKASPVPNATSPSANDSLEEIPLQATKSTTTTENNGNNDNVNYDSEGEKITLTRSTITSSSNTSPVQKALRDENVGYFSILTSAVIWNILSLVDAFDLCQLSRTSAHFFKLATNEFLWERLYIKVFRKNNKVDKALWYEQLQHGGYRSLFGTKLCEEQLMKTLRSMQNQSPEANAVEWIFKPFVSVQNFFSAVEAKIVMIGLDYSGKTSILNKLARGEHVKTEHTIGFNHETVEHKGYKFDIWDLEHKTKNSLEFWKTYFPKSTGIIFVVDGTAPERLAEARACLASFLAEPQLADLPLLIFVNKRDVVESMSTLQVLVGLNLHYLCNRSGWHIQPCSATANDSTLAEGLDWFCQTFKHEEVLRLKTKIVSPNANNSNE